MSPKLVWPQFVYNLVLNTNLKKGNELSCIYLDKNKME